MRLLLDTHVFLWWLGDDSRLSRVGRDLIRASENSVCISAVTAWEIEIKRALGKLRFDGSVAVAVASQGFEPLPIDFSHTEESARLPAIHSDPFDRLLVAQARIENLHLLSVDQRVLNYPVSGIDCSKS